MVVAGRRRHETTRSLGPFLSKDFLSKFQISRFFFAHFLYFHIFLLFFSKYWNTKRSKYFFLLNFQTLEVFPVFPAFPVFLKGRSYRTTFSQIFLFFFPGKTGNISKVWKFNWGWNIWNASHSNIWKKKMKIRKYKNLREKKKLEILTKGPSIRTVLRKSTEFFHSRVIGACPVTTDCIVATS